MSRFPPFTRQFSPLSLLQIYSGVAGLYDFGPAGCSVKENFLAVWKRHFVLQEGMLQMECTTLTPASVLKVSGHVDKFADLMVKDTKTGECFRADKLLEDTIDQLLTGEGSETLLSAERTRLMQVRAQADAFTPAQLHEQLTQLKVVSPTSGAELTEPFPFNLMFATSIGPAGNMPGFLRPETAQGMFVNFKRLLEYNNGRVPFAACQIGTAYRNEIAPKNGLLRVREFTMAEIEHFVHPQEKEHTAFASVAGLELQLFPARNQLSDGKLVHMSVGDAVVGGVIANETLAYFVARTALFLVSVGIRPEGLRFRQHLANEMAHYACDCWDAEILMASGWVECVGHADRAAYDLAVHSAASKTDLVVSRPLPTPLEVPVVVMGGNKGLMGKHFKGANKAVQAALAAACDAGAPAMALQASLDATGEAALAIEGGATVTLTKDMVSFEAGTKKIHEEVFQPSVIEPSFGVGRILEGIFQHTFYIRPDPEAEAAAAAAAAAAGAGDKKKKKGAKKDASTDIDRAVFAFPPVLAPTKVAVFVLDSRVPPTVVQPIVAELTRLGVTSIVDNATASIGKRYSRCDELGIPFGVTVDFQTESSGQVTLRERDSTAQVYLKLAQAPRIIRDLAEETITWAQVFAEHEVKNTGAPVHPLAIRPQPKWVQAPPAPAASAAGTAEPAVPVATAAPPSPAGGTAVPKEPVTVEGAGRTSGHFTRPANPIA